jgi:hypothetical protein
MSPNFPKIKFILRINSHCVNVLTACSSGVNLFFYLYWWGSCCSICQIAYLHVFSTISGQKRCAFSLTLTWWVSLVEQELLTLLSSSPVFNGVHVAWYLVFCVVFNKLWFVLLSFFFWLTASDYPFGIFKHFLNKIYIIRYVSFMLYKLNLICPLDR